MGIPYAEVIGDPIAHSKSPLIHKFWLEKLGLDYDYRRTLVAPGQLQDFLERRRADPDWCGCNVTMPHKRAVLDLLDEVQPAARRIGAVNCIVREGRGQPRLLGTNSDWSGFLEPLKPWLERDHQMRLAYVVGTGGAAAAVSYALVNSDFTLVTVGRDPAKQLALRYRLDLRDDDLCTDLAWLADTGPGDWGDRTDVLDLLVNATPLGMRGFPPLQIDLRGRPDGSLVYDLVYDPLDTLLLRDARERGMQTIDGLAMLISQAARAFELFFVEEAPREHDAELRELLTR
jgi:shikimate dehydrogenase